MSALHNLNPTRLWHHFAQICAIPHPSRHEEALIQHIEQWASARGIQHLRDQAGNLVLRLAACNGYENAPGIILQSHLDMVPQRRENSRHDFLSDPIQPQLIDGWVTATGTTLGADNGIGVAAILAVFEQADLIHGPLEALLTVNEEAGMEGAKGLEPGLLQGSLLLNLDSEQEGELYLGCAGGIDVTSTLPISRDSSPRPLAAFNVSVSGLLGGHSGLDIHRQRGNACQLLAELVTPLISTFEGQLVLLEAGSLRNAIARQGEAVIACPNAAQNPFFKALTEQADRLQEQWSLAEPGLRLEIHQTELDQPALTATSSQQLLQAIAACPHGVISMDPALEGVVETSNNLARITLTDHEAQLECLARSARESARDLLCQQIANQLQPLGATTRCSGAYPGWTPAADAPLFGLIDQVHQGLFGVAATPRVIHAGLECGLLAASYPHWQMISFGPTIRSPHSPDERVEVASVERFWRLLTHSLTRLAQL